MMITLPGLAADALGAFLADDMRDRFGVSHARLAEIVPFAARLALECIGNSDALYHNVEHTMLVTLAGHDIFKGRALLTASTPDDYSHFIVACLSHDIGYVRGVLKGDGPDGYVVDASGHKVKLPRGSLRRRARALSRRAVKAVRPRSPGVDRGARRRTDRGSDPAYALPLFHGARRAPRPRGCGAAAGRRPDRPARRSALSEEGQRALPGV